MQFWLELKGPLLTKPGRSTISQFDSPGRDHLRDGAWVIGNWGQDTRGENLGRGSGGQPDSSIVRPTQYREIRPHCS